MGGRGVKHEPQDRDSLLEMLDQAQAQGVSQATTCKWLGISERTVQRWRKQGNRQDQRKGPLAGPANKLREEERKKIIEVVTSPEYRDLSPKQIVPKLADQGLYYGSESTYFRIMRSEKMQHHRAASKPPEQTKPREKIATAPDQVWSWDITYMLTTIRGVFYYLYLVMDVWSRKIVGWAVHAQESQLLAAVLVERAVQTHGARPGLILHSDNGGPMTGGLMVAKLQDLQVIPSLSRPGVSDDNPFSEALFKTMKYRPEYPSKPFASLENAQQWVEKFVHWYNTEHLHSMIGFVTAQQRYEGKDKEIFTKRTEVYEQAKERNPERWSGPVRKWDGPEQVILNPDGKTQPNSERKKKGQAEQSSRLRNGAEQDRQNQKQEAQQRESALIAVLKEMAEARTSGVNQGQNTVPLQLPVQATLVAS